MENGPVHVGRTLLELTAGELECADLRDGVADGQREARYGRVLLGDEISLLVSGDGTCGQA